mmetsp:Transcript_26797/g.46200  ORF Transcript_26797/g.46200 Transcript_26797/m.46200 type:complete len:89 (+) Transcript_26797:41-307(+)
MNPKTFQLRFHYGRRLRRRQGAADNFFVKCSHPTYREKAQFGVRELEIHPEGPGSGSDSESEVADAILESCRNDAFRGLLYIELLDED